MLRICLSLVFAGLALAAASLPAPAQVVYTPQAGSAARAGILDGVRPLAENILQTPVVFVVRTMNVSNSWAFVALDPQHPGGGRIDPASTPLDMREHDGLTIYALLRNTGSGWQMVDWSIGPTDAAWAPWASRFGAPAEIFP